MTTTTRKRTTKKAPAARKQQPRKAPTGRAGTPGRAAINSRKPTGQVPWPCILVEGEEKAGKTWLAYLLSASDRIGDAFAIDLGEGSADEYGVIGDFEVLYGDPDDPTAPWTYAALLDQVAAVREYAREQLEAGADPVLLTIDTASDEWGVLVDAISAKAATSDRNRKILADDPAAEIKIPNHLWNDANAKHKRLMVMLMTFPGIVVLTARGKEVAEVRNGAPVEGSKVWKVEGQRHLPYQVTTWIRMRRDAPPTLEGCRSVHIGLRPGIDAARDLRDVAQNLGHERASFAEHGLEWLIFDALRLDPATATVRDVSDLTDDGVALGAEKGGVQDPSMVLERVRTAWDNVTPLRLLYREINERGFRDAPVPNYDGGLGKLVGERIDALDPPQEPQGAPNGGGTDQTPTDRPQGPESGSQPPNDAGSEPGEAFTNAEANQ